MNDVVALPLANRLNEEIKELNGKYAVVFIGSSLRILWEKRDPTTGETIRLFLSPNDFRTLTKNQRAADPDARSVSDFFINHPDRRQYETIDFIPGPTPEGVYNLWKGFAVAPKEGTTTRFWELVRDGICAGNTKVYGFVRKWLAHLVQKPNELPGTALVLRGKQGTGKNTFVDAIGHLLGEHYVSVNSLDQITGRFNSHLGSTLLVHANEAIWGGNKTAEGALKAMITDSKMPYEAKGKDTTFVQNFKRLIVSSNEEWAVPRGLDDRRFCVLDVSDKFKEDQATFAAIRKELEEGGHAALMHNLQGEDLADFNPRVIPVTSAGLDMKLKSASSAVRWLFEFLKEGYRSEYRRRLGDALEIPEAGGEIEKEKVYENYSEFCLAVEHGRPDTKSQFWKALRKANLDLKDVRPAQGGSRLRNVVFPSLADARIAFERLVKQQKNIDWED